MDHHDSDGDVIVTLSSEGNALDIVMHPERHVHLTREKSRIVVGRASKASHKGLMPGAENAWFESPVMSRNHAEIVADLNAQTVSIRDTNSMHGTFINNKVLPQDTLVPVRSGDKVQFGISIERSHEHFLPTIVQMGIEFGSGRPVTFEVPDSSESESESEIDNAESIPDRDFLSPGVHNQVVEHEEGPFPINCVDLTSPRGPLSPVFASVSPQRTSFVEPYEQSDPQGSEIESSSGSESENATDSDGDTESVDDGFGHELLDDVDRPGDVDNDAPVTDGSEEGSIGEPFLDDGLEETFHWDEADSDTSESSGDEEGLDGRVNDNNAHDFPSSPPSGLNLNADISVPLAPEASVCWFQTPAPPHLSIPSSMTARQPSPSDAAMPKSLPSLDHIGLNTGSNGAYKSHEFFAAREENKSKVAPSAQTDCSNLISGHAGRSICSSTADSRRTPEALLNPVLSVGSPQVEITPLIRSGMQFLCSPLADEPGDTSFHYVGEDLTSAVAFEQSKRQLKQSLGPSAVPPAAVLDHVSPSTFPRRTYVGINDIVCSGLDRQQVHEVEPVKDKSPIKGDGAPTENEQPQVQPPQGEQLHSENQQIGGPQAPKKRKISEISEVTEEELAFAEKILDSVNGSSSQAQKPTASGPASKLDLHSAGVAHDPLPGVTSEETRPAKRLLHSFAKQAGIATLGLITGGTLVFGSLAYMAPDF